jgi:hypothetical protein
MAGLGKTNPDGTYYDASGVLHAANGSVMNQTTANIFGNSPTPLTPNADLGSQITNKLSQGVANVGDGNTNQVQGGVQQGAFNTIGTNAQTQAQTSSNQSNSLQQQNQTGTQSTQDQSNQIAQQIGQQNGVSNTSGQTIGQTQNLGQTQEATSNVGNTSGLTQNTGQTQAQTQNTGTTTTGVNDTLGFGQLLQGQQGQATATDATRNNYLTNLLQNGDPALQQQTQAAVNSALSGPGMVGTGDSAQARAAGYAAANVARNSEANQLAASQQLAGGTATTNLASAANPYLGQTAATTNTGNTTENTANTGVTNQQTANTGTTSGTSAQTGTSGQSTTGQTNTAQNTSNLSNTANTGSSNTNTANSGTTSNSTSSLGSTLSSLLANNSSSGNSSAQNAQAAYGTTPQQTSSSGSGGGSVICTVLGERGWLPRWMLEDELMHVKANIKEFKSAAKGYLFWGVPLAKLARRNVIVAALCWPIAYACAYEASRRAKVRYLTKNIFPILAYHLFLISNSILGQFIPGEPKVTDPEIKKLLSDSGLELDLEEQL